MESKIRPLTETEQQALLENPAAQHDLLLLAWVNHVMKTKDGTPPPQVPPVKFLYDPSYRRELKS